MIRLVCLSNATVKMTEKELTYLLGQARRNNTEHNVTGMLLYINDYFFQIIEGEREVVEYTYSKIENDSRNWGNMIILEEEISKREFPDWSMGFEVIDPQITEGLDGFSDFLQSDIVTTRFNFNRSKVQKMLENFKRNNLTTSPISV